jgi:hypothetical protein
VNATERLDAIEARAAAATEGPWVPIDLDREINGETVTGADHGWWWVWREAAVPYYGGVLEADGDMDVRGDDGRIYRTVGGIGETSITDGTTPQERTDAEFIAHARQDIPALVAALRAALEACDRAERKGHPFAWYPVRDAITAALDGTR